MPELICANKHKVWKANVTFAKLSKWRGIQLLLSWALTDGRNNNCLERRSMQRILKTYSLECIVRHRESQRESHPYWLKGAWCKFSGWSHFPTHTWSPCVIHDMCPHLAIGGDVSSPIGGQSLICISDSNATGAEPWSWAEPGMGKSKTAGGSVPS